MRFLSLALLLASVPLAAHAQQASPEERMRLAEQRIMGMLGIEAEAAEPAKDTAPAKPRVEKVEDEYDPSVTLGNFFADLQEASANVLGAGMGNLGAVAAAQNGGSNNQNSAQAQIFAGKAYIFGANGDRAKAIEHYEQAVKLDPQFSKAFYNLACEYAKDQQREKALLNLQKALALSSGLKAHALQDPDFAALRGSQEFKKLVQ
jgi:tetratricopeptide (TPR) repeat protein